MARAPLQTLSSPHLNCGAVSTFVCQASSDCRPALNLPALGGFLSPPTHPLIPLPPPPVPCLSLTTPPSSGQLLLPSCWKLAPTPLAPQPGQEAVPSRPPLHPEGHVQSLGRLFQVTSGSPRVPSFSHATQMYLLPTRHLPDATKDRRGFGQLAGNGGWGLHPARVTGSVTQGSTSPSSKREWLGGGD